MSFSETLETFRRDCLHGELTLRPGESMKRAVARENVSQGFGVYLIRGCQGEDREILYVGKAGTIAQSGVWRKQGIRKRLTMKQDGKYREELFPWLIKERQLDGLHFEWFETFRDDSGKPPFLAEAELLAAYFQDFRRLPPLNNAA